MPNIKQITLPTGTTYDIVDQGARDLIDEMSGYTDFLGVTTTALTDGATTNPITINGASVTAKKGNIVTYGSAEFIFNGTAWQLFGDLSGLGDLAFKDSASGTVAVPKTYTTTVTPSTTSKYVASSSTGGGSATKETVTISSAGGTNPTFTPAGDVKYTPQGGTQTTNEFTPEGTVSIGSITVTPSTTSQWVASSKYSGSSSTKETVTVSAAATGETTYTPSGSNGSSSVSGSCSVTPQGSISVGTGTANYTPAGSVAAPTISLATAGSTTTIKNPTSKTVVTDMSVSAAASGTATGELVYCSVSNETLTFSKFIETTGASISTSNVTVKNGDASYSANAPAFTGTGAQLKFTGSSSTGTISGTAAAQTFTGSGVRLVTDSEVYTAVTMPTFGQYTSFVNGITSATANNATFSGKKITSVFAGAGRRLVTDKEVYTDVTMPSFSSQTIATGVSSASTTTATTENKTVTVT